MDKNPGLRLSDIDKEIFTFFQKKSKNTKQLKKDVEDLSNKAIQKIKSMYQIDLSKK